MTDDKTTTDQEQNTSKQASGSNNIPDQESAEPQIAQQITITVYDNNQFNVTGYNPDPNIALMHFRMAEDFIIWATNEFNFINIDWSMCTGSSIMPHKKNPDILELIRGETAGLYSNLNEVLMLLKGLPLTYNRDLQLDKPPLFQSVEKIKDMLELLTKLFASLKVNTSVVEKRINDESLFSVDIMEYLIKKGVSYREAHDIVGTMIKECTDKGKNIADLTKGQLKNYSPKFDLDVKKLLNPEMSVKIKKSLGSTNPILVKQQIKKWKKLLNLGT